MNPPIVPALDLNWMTGQPLATDTFPATGQPSGAQGGQPDWPLTPVSDAVAATSGFLVSVTAGTFDAGFPTELVTPWTASSLLLAAAPAVLPPAVVTSTTNATTTTVAVAPDTTDTVAAVVTASKSDDSSSATLVIVILVLLIAAAVVAVAMTRRRRSPSALPPPVAEPLPVIRTTQGLRTTSVSQPVQSWSIGVRTAPGQRTTSGRVIDPEDQKP